nr:MAG TPA: hypothetical protein [Caudoviricetes sp.]
MSLNNKKTKEICRRIFDRPECHSGRHKSRI